MSCYVTKNYYSPQKKRILLLNTAEIRHKTKIRQPYCNLYAYGANNPVRYIDPDGRDVFMAGITVNFSFGTGFTGETGLIISKDKNGNWQLGTYQISGGGFAPSLGASATTSFSWAPFAEHISDVSGLTETMGGSFSFGVVFGFNLGGDVNIPLDGPIKNFYISVHLGAGTSGGEGHALTTSTTTQLYGEGQSFTEAWNNAVDNGLLQNVGSDIIKHFKEAYMQQYNEPLPIPIED